MPTGRRCVPSMRRRMPSFTRTWRSARKEPAARLQLRTPTSRCARRALQRVPCWCRPRRRPGACRHPRSPSSRACSVIASGRQGRFGEFAEAASRLPVPADPPLKDPSAFRLIGREHAVSTARQREQGQRHRPVHHRYSRTGYAHRAGGAAAAVRRQGRIVRRQGRARGARRGRREADFDRVSRSTPTASGRRRKGREALRVTWDESGCRAAQQRSARHGISRTCSPSRRSS